jgi:transcriptional regulator of acetoin/glycerol metabolism
MHQSAAPALRKARHLLLESGDLPAGLVDSRLADSWRRSLASGLSPLGPVPDLPHLSAEEMRRAATQYHDLIANARPVMEHLFAQVRDSGDLVILADPHGLLLDALGEGEFLSRAERVTLKPGATWDEQYRGTNAIGTALRENASLVIHGAEHYLESNNFLTCAAAPILAPDFSLLGVLDISGDQRQQHPHTLGLVRTATQMIENRLFLSRHQRHVCLHLHPQAEGIGTVAEGLLALSEDGWIVAVNRAGMQFLSMQAVGRGALPVARVFDCPYENLISWGRRNPQQARPVITHRGESLYVRVDAGRAPLSVVSPAAPPASRIPVPTDALEKLNTGDRAMANAIGRGRRVLGKAIPVLLHGESGVGKELFARALHASGPRAQGPFVAVNCAALPEHLIEAELFGYSAGAFTGAAREGKVGRLREANGGTLFLDEIGDMPLALQSRLLRVLQEREVTPLGGGKVQAVDFALICATHRRLKDEVGAGRFRADLYYRLNGLTLALPSLRDRDDFATLTEHLLAEISPHEPLTLAPDVARALAAYAWPGNLRQLANALRTASALLDEHETSIDWEHLPEDLTEELLQPAGEKNVPFAAERPVSQNLRQLSRVAMDRVIVATNGNLSEAARRLGISRNTLYRKLKENAA